MAEREEDSQNEGQRKATYHGNYIGGGAVLLQISKIRWSNMKFIHYASLIDHAPALYYGSHTFLDECAQTAQSTFQT